MKTVALLAAFCTLSACTIIPPANGPLPPSADGIARVALGHKVYVDGPSVTPLAVIEDSRCPAEVQCVWAGRLIVRTRVAGGAWARTLDLELGKPQAVADGALTLVSARAGRFGYRFEGGL